jgi:hypothetical protein
MAVNPVVNISIPQGSDFTETFTSKESNGLATDLTGYSATAVLRKHAGATDSTTFTVGITSSTGKVSIAMTSGVTVAITPGRYVYDVRLVSGIGTVSRLVEGMAMVTAGVTTA